MTKRLVSYLTEQTSIAPLITFRVIFGAVMFFGVLRFNHYGWIESLYLDPKVYFPFFGWSWIQPYNPIFVYSLFVIIGFSSLGIALGYFYRLSAIFFFLSFSYVEIIDKSNYLNHHYFVCMAAFLLIFVPANAAYSLDAYFRKVSYSKVPRWTIIIFKLQLGFVYFFAGIAKINADWLLEAQPLKIWLKAHTDLPLIGSILAKDWAAYVFSWVGMFYDLTVAFALLYKPTRWLAYIAVVVFHVLTKILFQIGLFPLIMIGLTLIFFSDEFHEKLWTGLSDKTKLKRVVKEKVLLSVLAVYFVFQLLIPFRHLYYKGNLFWTERGYRFSWRVMLMEKAGHIQLRVLDKKNNREFYINNKKYLSPQQEKQVSFQPDMILDYVHWVEKDLKEQGLEDIAIFADCFVTLNGRGSQRYVDPTVDLTKVNLEGKELKWVIPLEGNGK